MKRVFMALLGLVLAASLFVSCNTTGGGRGRMTPGIYAATARSFMGYITVLVTVDRTSILAVDIVSSTDHPSVLTVHPLTQIPAAIVEAQSVAVDIVAGATFTSLAVMNATRDALNQAGGRGMFETRTARAPRTQSADETVDVLVIGAGASGILSALSAAYANLDGISSGLSVMLVERLGFIGGNMSLSGGSAITSAPLDSLVNVENEAMMEQLFTLWQNHNVGFEINRPLIRNTMRVAGDTMMRLQRLGLSVETAHLFGSPGAFTSIDQRTTPYRMAVRRNIETYNQWFWRGEAYDRFFHERLDHADIDLRVNTRATELILDSNGAVIGARMTGPYFYYNVFAQKVILATGGLAANRELVARHAPTGVGVIPFVIGSGGDGFIMAEAVDAKVVGDMLIGYLGTCFRFGMWSDLDRTFHTVSNPAIAVNTEGRRFVRDSMDYNVFDVYEALIRLPVKRAFAIVDSDSPTVPRIEASRQVEFWWRANTIEELAVEIGVPVANLVNTINSINAMYAEGRDCVEFGVSNNRLLPVRNAPFYAVALNPVSIGSLVGLAVNEHTQVLNTRGEIVPNLYAVGEMSFGGNWATIYIGAWGNGYALASGRIAGEHAKAAILNQRGH